MSVYRPLPGLAPHRTALCGAPTVVVTPAGVPACQRLHTRWPVATHTQRGLIVACSSRQPEVNGSSTPTAQVPTPAERVRTIALAALASAALVFGPCDEAQAARSGGRVGSHRTHNMTQKRTAAYNRRGSAGVASSASPSARRYRVPMSVRLHAAPRLASSAATYARPPLLIGDLLTHPALASGIDLEALPLWASLLGLLGANLAGLAAVIAVLRNLQDGSEPLTIIKVQVAMLERRPQLQSKLAQLSSMIQVGQQGAWLILEEAVLQLLQHQSRIAYASVTQERLTSKKRAYAVFGEMAEAEAAKANREEAVVKHMGETIDDESDPSSSGGGDGGGLFGGLISGGRRLAGLGPPAKELTVVTLILATRGKLDVQGQVTDWPSLRRVMQQVTGLSSDKIMAIELLWTPRRETDYLTRAQLERDYPDLLPLGPQQQPAAK